jgi:hypothetical protein
VIQAAISIRLLTGEFTPHERLELALLHEVNPPWKQFDIARLIETSKAHVTRSKRSTWRKRRARICNFVP